jgi:PD-(D/E)XK nuclease superfamily
MERAPVIMAVNPMPSITFSQWAALKRCKLKASLHSATLDGRLPDSLATRASLVGNFHHRSMELAAKIQSPTDLRDALEVEIVKLQSIVSASPHLRRLGSVSGWDEVNRSVVLACERGSAGYRTSSRTLAVAETGLRSASGLLQGRPDFFSVGHSVAHLREYKSGRIRDEDGHALTDYIEQAKFYSCLIVDNFAVTSVIASIESLSGDRHELTISRADARQFEIEVGTALADFNQHIPSREHLSVLANPSTEVCAFCDGRVCCASFKQLQDELELSGEQFIIQGRFGGFESRAMQCVVVVQDIYRAERSELLVPQAIGDQLVKDASYLFLNVSRHGAGWLWGHSSRVFLSD